MDDGTSVVKGSYAESTTCRGSFGNGQMTMVRE
jgi:hypothetical protein